MSHKTTDQLPYRNLFLRKAIPFYENILDQALDWGGNDGFTLVDVRNRYQPLISDCETKAHKVILIIPTAAVATESNKKF
jgi:hypothetical protein